MGRSRRHISAGVLVLFGLAGCGLSGARAQVYYDGGFRIVKPSSRVSGTVPAHRYDSHPVMDFGYTYANYSPSAPASTVAGRRTEAASPRPYDIPAAVLPWKQADFAGYEESVQTAVVSSVGAADKYALEASALDHRIPARERHVVLVAHVPEHAALWIGDSLTRSKGRTRYFVSPALNPGKDYHYTVRAVWFEEGRWVSQAREVAVQPGQVHGVYLKMTPAAVALKKQHAVIEANLARLSADDQKVARLQKKCAVCADTWLGQKGVPVKILVKNRRVFVADEASAKKLLADPDKDKVLARALELRSKYAPPGK